MNNVHPNWHNMIGPQNVCTHLFNDNVANGGTTPIRNDAMDAKDIIPMSFNEAAMYKCTDYTQPLTASLDIDLSKPWTVSFDWKYKRNGSAGKQWNTIFAFGTYTSGPATARTSTSVVILDAQDQLVTGTTNNINFYDSATTTSECYAWHSHIISHYNGHICNSKDGVIVQNVEWSTVSKYSGLADETKPGGFYLGASGSATGLAWTLANLYIEGYRVGSNKKEVLVYAPDGKNNQVTLSDGTVCNLNGNGSIYTFRSRYLTSKQNPNTGSYSIYCPTNEGKVAGILWDLGHADYDIECWTYMMSDTKTTTRLACAFNLEYSNSNSIALGMDTTCSSYTLKYGASTKTYSMTGLLNTWVHHLIRYDHTTRKISWYLNGTQVLSETTYAEGLDSTTNTPYILTFGHRSRTSNATDVKKAYTGNNSSAPMKGGTFNHPCYISNFSIRRASTLHTIDSDTLLANRNQPRRFSVLNYAPYVFNTFLSQDDNLYISYYTDGVIRQSTEISTYTIVNEVGSGKFRQLAYSPYDVFQKTAGTVITNGNYWTVSFWLKFESVTGADKIDKSTNVTLWKLGSNHSIRMVFNSSTNLATINLYSSKTSVASTTNLYDQIKNNQWNHIAMCCSTYQKSGTSLYINGIKQFSANVDTSSLQAHYPTAATSTTITNYYNLYIDDPCFIPTCLWHSDFEPPTKPLSQNFFDNLDSHYITKDTSQYIENTKFYNEHIKYNRVYTLLHFDENGPVDEAYENHFWVTAAKNIYEINASNEKLKIRALSNSCRSFPLNSFTLSFELRYISGANKNIDNSIAHTSAFNSSEKQNILLGQTLQYNTTSTLATGTTITDTAWHTYNLTRYTSANMNTEYYRLVVDGIMKTELTVGTYSSSADPKDLPTNDYYFTIGLGSQRYNSSTGNENDAINWELRNVVISCTRLPANVDTDDSYDITEPQNLSKSEEFLDSNFASRTNDSVDYKFTKFAGSAVWKSEENYDIDILKVYPIPYKQLFYNEPLNVQTIYSDENQTQYEPVAPPNMTGYSAKCVSNTNCYFYSANNWLTPQEQDFTFEGWFGSRSLAHRNYEDLICIFGTTNYFIRVYLRGIDLEYKASLYVHIKYGNTERDLSSAGVSFIKNDSVYWIHIAATYTYIDKTIAFYVNGKYIGKVTFDMWNTFSTIILGSSSVGNNACTFNGYIYEFYLRFACTYKALDDSTLDLAEKVPQKRWDLLPANILCKPQFNFYNQSIEDEIFYNKWNNNGAVWVKNYFNLAILNLEKTAYGPTFNFDSSQMLSYQRLWLWWNSQCTGFVFRWKSTFKPFSKLPPQILFRINEHTMLVANVDGNTGPVWFIESSTIPISLGSKVNDIITGGMFAGTSKTFYSMLLNSKESFLTTKKPTPINWTGTSDTVPYRAIIRNDTGTSTYAWTYNGCKATVPSEASFKPKQGFFQLGMGNPAAKDTIELINKVKQGTIISALHYNYSGTLVDDVGNTWKATTLGAKVALGRYTPYGISLRHNSTSTTVGVHPSIITVSDATLSYNEDWTLSFWIRGYGGSSSYDSASILSFDKSKITRGPTTFGVAHSGVGSDQAILLEKIGTITRVNGSSGITFFDDNWNHVAVVNHDGIMKMYCNGILVCYSTHTFTFNLANFKIGSPAYTSGTYNIDDAQKAIFDDLFIVKGAQLWEEDFVPPSYPLVWIAQGYTGYGSGKMINFCGFSLVYPGTVGTSPVLVAGNPSTVATEYRQNILLQHFQSSFYNNILLAESFKIILGLAFDENGIRSFDNNTYTTDAVTIEQTRPVGTKFNKHCLDMNNSTGISINDSFDSLDHNGKWTISFWNYKTTSSGTDALLYIDDYNKIKGFYNSYNGNNGLQYVDQAGNVLYSASNSFPLNQWVHISIVNDGTTLTVYQNGISQFVVNLAPGEYININDVVIGANPYITNSKTGYIDDILIAREALYSENFEVPVEAVFLLEKIAKEQKENEGIDETEIVFNIHGIYIL